MNLKQVFLEALFSRFNYCNKLDEIPEKAKSSKPFKVKLIDFQVGHKYELLCYIWIHSSCKS